MRSGGGNNVYMYLGERLNVLSLSGSMLLRVPSHN